MPGDHLEEIVATAKEDFVMKGGRISWHGSFDIL